jgi:transcriptional regulator with XRE-family HTH domain
MTASQFALPEAISAAISNGIPTIRAYREHLGYSIDDIAITSGLTVDEVELIESGHRFAKGYRDRIAKAFGLSDGTFDDISTSRMLPEGDL